VSAANTIPALSDRISQALAELGGGDRVLRGLLESAASAAASAQSSEALAPSVGALGRFAVDEIDSAHPFSHHVSAILAIYQAIIRAERRQSGEKSAF
jgi:hypothetical protein